MLPSAHPLAPLQTLAALASGWPTLHLFGDDEASVEAALTALQALLGPLPQADLIEPWSPDDPEPRWELRVDLPDLSAETWHAIQQHLPDAILVPGLREGARAAQDLGLLHLEPLHAGDGLIAWMPGDEEGSLTPDLARARGADAQIQDLEVELAHAIRAIDPAIAFRSDRGPDTVQPVVHRQTGRFGIQLTFGPETFEGLDGDAVAARRQALLTALSSVLARRASHPLVRLAPDVRWDVPLGGLSLLAWILAPAVPALPVDSDVPPGLSPTDPALTALLADPSQLESIELQVVPTTPAAHDRVVEQITATLSHDGPVRGALPRWLRVGGRWVFCPIWQVPTPDVGPELRPLLDQLAALDEVAALRVVPGEPCGLGDVWSVCQPAWTWGPLHALVRVRDALTDRDRLPEAAGRPRHPRDAQVEVQAFAALVAAGEPAGLLPGAPGPGRAIVDSAGREGLEFSFDARSFSAEPLRSTLSALGAVGHPELAPVSFYAHRHDRTVVRLWFRATQDGDPPRWR